MTPSFSGEKSGPESYKTNGENGHERTPVRELGQSRRGDEILRWQIIGPFAYNSFDAAYDSVHPIEKEGVRLYESYPAGIDKQTWRVAESSKSGIELLKVAGPPPVGKAGVYFAACWTKFNKYRHQPTFSITYSCGWKLYVNGRLLKGVPQTRSASGGASGGFEKSLQEGWNAILLKLVVFPGYIPYGAYSPTFRFLLPRLRDRAGRLQGESLAEIVTELPPPEGNGLRRDQP
jgi:hypothetical protein